MQESKPKISEVVKKKYQMALETALMDQMQVTKLDLEGLSGVKVS
jgi:hypothetical protein